MSILSHISFNLGYAILPVFAYFLRQWRYLQLSYSLVSLIYLIYICVIHESPRWLFSTGRLPKATYILKKIAKFNRMPTDNIELRLRKDYENVLKENVLIRGSVIDLFATPTLYRRTLTLIAQWTIGGAVFFGAPQFISTLGGNIFLHVSVCGLLGIPAIVMCILCTKYLGRRPCLLISSFLTSVFFMVIAITITLNELVTVCLGLLNMLITSVTMKNLYLYTGEIFPTVVRSSGLGMCVSFSRIGAMIAPFISNDLGQRFSFLPPVLYAVASFVSFGLAFDLPETRNMPIPNTMDEAENFGPIRRRVRSINR